MCTPETVKAAAIVGATAAASKMKPASMRSTQKPQIIDLHGALNSLLNSLPD